MASRGPLYRFTPYQVARINRNNVIEFNEDYLETHLDPETLDEMHKNDRWLDQDGFYRGFPYTCATYIGSQPAIILGIKIGGGIKVVIPPNRDVLIINNS